MQMHLNRRHPERVRSPSRGTPAFVFASVCAILLNALCAAALPAQTVHIKLIDGESGHPVAGVCLGAWMKARMPLYVVLRTDKNGDAQLRLTQTESDVDTHYNLRLGCGGTGAIDPVLKDNGTLTFASWNYPSCAFPESVPRTRNTDTEFSTKEVVEHGVASANMCGTITASPQPGQVVFFVRPRNRQEKKRDCMAGEFPILCW